MSKAWTLRAGVIASCFLGISCNAITGIGDYEFVENAAGTPGTAGSGGGAACSTALDCAELGEYHVCREGSCVSLLSPECTKVVGDYTSPNAVLFGTIMPTTGVNGDIGTTFQNSIEIAHREIQSIRGGLPPVPGQTATRPIVLVMCDDESSNASGEAAAKHLAEVVEVPAIMGSYLSGVTMNYVTKVAIPNGVLNLSPGNTSSAFATLDDQNLYWRTVEDSGAQVLALAAFYKTLEDDLEATLEPGKSVRVVNLHKDDTYGKTTSQAIQDVLEMAGKPAVENAGYRRITYGNPSDPAASPVRYAESAQETIGFAPHVIFLSGTNELMDDVITLIESEWPANADHRPYYLSGWGIHGKSLWEWVKANNPNDSLRKRMLLAVPGSNGAAYKNFRLNYKSQISDGTIPESAGASHAYDAMYVIAYAAAAVGDEPLTGANLALALPKVADTQNGLKKPVGTVDVNTLFAALGEGKTIDLDGASGSLDFDAAGEVKSDVQITCFPLAQNQVQPGSYSGLYFDVNRKQVGTTAIMRTNCVID